VGKIPSKENEPDFGEEKLCLHTARKIKMGGKRGEGVCYQTKRHPGGKDEEALIQKRRGGGGAEMDVIKWWLALLGGVWVNGERSRKREKVIARELRRQKRGGVEKEKTCIHETDLASWENERGGGKKETSEVPGEKKERAEWTRGKFFPSGGKQGAWEEKFFWGKKKKGGRKKDVN